MPGQSGLLSVIIPTLNEETDLPATLSRARAACRASGTRFIVADCNSRDRTVELARAAGAHVVLGGTSRATAMNLGAGAAEGSAMLFLHADSRPPEGFDARVLGALARPGVVGGAFDFDFASHPLSKGIPRQMLKLVRITNRIRFRWTGNFYGDQGIFVASDVFRAMGGFPEVGLMEDLYFSRRLKHLGRLVILSPPIRTSPRRFLIRGVLRQYFADLRLLAGESLSVKSERAFQRYNHLNCAGHGAGHGGAGNSERRDGTIIQKRSPPSDATSSAHRCRTGEKAGIVGESVAG
jgi:rSAM/selenodomain-associated transferase 2